MATNRGELDLHIGKQTRTLTFKTFQVAMLQKRLGMDAISFLGQSGGLESFLIEAIFCGLSQLKGKKFGPPRIAAWLDEGISVDGHELTREEAVQKILYTIAHGKPEKERKEMLEALDEAFGGEGNEPKPTNTEI